MVKRLHAHPQKQVQLLRQGKKTFSSATTEKNESNTSASIATSKKSFKWKPIIGNKLVDDVSYKKLEDTDEPEIITLETINDYLKRRQFSKIAGSIIKVEN